MGAAGQRLGLRLFLEGFEVPVIAAQVSANINAPAVASIQVVPGDRVLELRARTMVHLFFWDFTQDNEPAVDKTNPEAVARFLGVTVDQARTIMSEEPEKIEAEFDELKGYKLLYSGEVIGVTLLKSPTGRQAVLQCSDFSTYWDTTYQFFVSYSPNGNFLGTSAAVWAGGASMFDDLTAGHVSVLNEYIRDTPKTPGLQKVKGLMGGIISLLEAMGGVPRHSHGVNDFFTIAELKNHILQQIVAEQNDDTSQRLFGNKAFMDWLMRGMSSMGQLVTFRDMMKLLFKYIYYEVVPNPAAMYVPSSLNKRTQVVNVLTSDEITPKQKSTLESLLSRAVTNARLTFESTSPDEDKAAKAFKNELTTLTGSLPKSHKKVLEQAPPWLDKIQSLRGVARTTPFPPPKFNANRQAWSKTEGIIRQALSVGPRSERKQVKNNSKVELDRLHTQIFRPDCFFAAPPRCNVLFPDQYTQFSFSRNFLQETTRLRLSIGWFLNPGGGGLLGEYHFAPATKTIREVAKQQGNNGIRALLPWEVFSGILPKFETVHDINYVAGRNERKLGIKGNLKGAVTNYNQRVANFNFMKYRFAARTCEVSAKFNPFMVLGFPALVIDKPFIFDPSVDREALTSALGVINQERKEAKLSPISADDTSDFVREVAREMKAPSQYLGMVAALNHSVGQDGGGTSVVLTHARTHRITDDDFLNVFSKEVSRAVNTQIEFTVLDAEELLKKGDWAGLKFLIDATPQDILDLMRREDSATQEQEDADTDESPPLESRPDGGFGSLISPQSDEVGTQVVVSSNSMLVAGRSLPIHGPIKKEPLKGARRTIEVPGVEGKLKPGSKGPKGGKVSQIECFSDAAIMVRAADINRKSARVTGFAEQVRVDESGNLVPFIIDESGNPADVVPDPAGPTKRKRPGSGIQKDKHYFMWRRIAIYEETKRKATLTKLLPVEEALRPPWFSPLYSNWFIGDQIYKPFFGTGSIVDQALFLSPEGGAAFGTGRAAQQEILDKLHDAQGDNAQILRILEDAKAESISDVPDVESSVDALAYIYGEVCRLGLDVHRFVNDYTRRPIATMEEIFGSRDLEYETSGNKLVLKSGIPGFHSTAILDVGGKLLGLLDNPDVQLPRLKRGSGKKAPISAELDPRPGRMEKVRAYLEEINAGSGSLGIGVQG